MLTKYIVAYLYNLAPRKAMEAGMSITSSPQRYGAVAAAIHWVTALAVLLMLASGQVMDMQPDAAGAILPFHVVTGMLIGVLTLFRILWWLAFDRQPAPQPGLPVWQERLARLVHWGLYAALLVLFASGMAMLVLLDALGPIFSGGVLPQFAQTPARLAHGLVGRLLLLLAALHIGAALWHQFIRRDHLLARMGLGR